MPHCNNHWVADPFSIQLSVAIDPSPSVKDAVIFVAAIVRANRLSVAPFFCFNYIAEKEEVQYVWFEFLLLLKEQYVYGTILKLYLISILPYLYIGKDIEKLT